MDYEFSKLIQKSKDWADDAHQLGWLTKRDCDLISSQQTANPGSLFRSTQQRPLVVAFFGGTGVGKSTLLNRLAAQNIARTGVERPTSREISVYLHHSIHIDQLPAEFPVDKILITHHHNQERKEMMWVDMPDIDSIEAANREIVLEWLPHIDVVIYVVSPERYRDDKGWRMLRSDESKHAWLFIMNHWDKGNNVQYEDFEQQLSKVGFEKPVILRTDCSQTHSSQTQDDFSQLEQTIESLANAHTINQLEIRGMQIQLDRLEQNMESCLSKLGTEEAFVELATVWDSLWKQTTEFLQKALEWPIQQISNTFVTGDTSLLLNRYKFDNLKHSDDEKNQELRPALEIRPTLWDDWAQTRLTDVFDQFIVEADAKEIPITPIKAHLDGIRDKTKSLIETEAEQSLREALAKPGNTFQRFFLKLIGFSATLLPLAAIASVAYQVFHGYYASSLSEKQYLGIDFAIHSLLLVVMAWLLPWFLHRKLQPATEKVAFKGLKNGVESGFSLIEDHFNEAFKSILSQRVSCLTEGRELIEQSRLLSTTKHRIENKLLLRLLQRGSE